MPLYTAFRERFNDPWNEYFEHLLNVVGYFPLYDLVSEAFKMFDVFGSSPDEEASFVKLLEVIKAFEEQGANTMKNFLEYSDDDSADDTWKIDIPKNIDALQVMTIHKAKGIEFPVVIVLLYDQSPRGRSFLLREDEETISILKVNKKIAENVDQLRELLSKEQFRDTVDAFNKLYVAFTRAEKEMYVIGVYKDEKKEPTSFLPQQGFEPGAKQVAESTVVMRENIFIPFHHTFRKPLAVQAYESMGTQEAARGEFIHRVFSCIEYVEGDAAGLVEAAIARVSAAVPAPIASEETKAMIQACLGARLLGEWFARKEGRSVLREQEIASREGALFRADRIVVDPNVVMVIDFKTGGDEHERDYRQQVNNYAALLKDVYPRREVRCCLAYVDLGIVRNIL